MFLLFAFLFLPLIFCPAIFNAYELAKIIFLRLFIEIVIGLSWIAILSGLLMIFKEYRKNTIVLTVLTYFFWVFLISITGESWLRSLFGNYFRQQGFFTFTHFIFLFLLIALLRNQIREKFLALSISIGAFLTSLYAIYQALLSLSRGNYFPEIAGAFGNPNFLGGYLIIALPFVAFLAQKQKGSWFLLFPQVLAIILSGSRVAILLLLILSCFYFYFFFKRGLSILILLLVFVLISTPSTLRATSPYENRLRIWRNGLMAFLKRPVTGWGLENFEYAFSSVLQPAKDFIFNDLRVDKAHNEFIEILVASGLIGFCLFLIIIIFALTSLWQKMKTSKNKDWWLAVFLSLSLFIVRSQLNPVSIAEQALFWFLIGLAAGSQISTRELAKRPQLKGRRFLAIMVISSLIFMGIINLRSFMADYYFKKGVEQEKINQQKATYFFKKARQLYPWEEVYQLKARF